MTDHPTYTDPDNDRIKNQIQCIIKNEFDSFMMSGSDRQKSAERSAELIMQVIKGRLR